MLKESIICTRDDKSKKIAFICNDLYCGLLSAFIAQSNRVSLMSDPTDRIANKISILLRSESFPKIWKIKKVRCPFAPRLFGYVRAHKSPVSIRPMLIRNPPHYMN